MTTIADVWNVEGMKRVHDREHALWLLRGRSWAQPGRWGTALQSRTRIVIAAAGVWIVGKKKLNCDREPTLMASRKGGDLAGWEGQSRERIMTTIAEAWNMGKNKRNRDRKPAMWASREDGDLVSRERLCNRETAL